MHFKRDFMLPLSYGFVFLVAFSFGFPCFPFISLVSSTFYITGRLLISNLELNWEPRLDSGGVSQFFYLDTYV